MTFLTRVARNNALINVNRELT